jgi:hypothetical protein
MLVKTAGFMDDYDWFVSQDIQTGDINLRVYHVNSIIHRDGSVDIYANDFGGQRRNLGSNSAEEIQRALFDKEVVR